MVAAMAATRGKGVHVSTSYVFDCTSLVAYCPDDARNPQCAYGRTKAEGEDKLRFEDLLVRTAWVHAAGGAKFVRATIRLMNRA